MRIIGFPAGMFQTNCYVVAPASGTECVVVDPGQEASPTLRRALEEHRLRPVAVLLTHGHFDHMADVAAVCAEYGIPAHIHPEDRVMLSDPGAMLGPDLAAMLAGMEFAEPAEVHELFDGEVLRLAGLTLDVDHVPGHSPGSVSFRFEAAGGDGPVPVVIGGDVLFQGGIGRTDLPGGDGEVLLTSIEKKFLTLPDDTVVLPGHGPATTIGEERRGNPFLRR